MEIETRKISFSLAHAYTILHRKNNFGYKWGKNNLSLHEVLALRIQDYGKRDGDGCARASEGSRLKPHTCTSHYGDRAAPCCPNLGYTSTIYGHDCGKPAIPAWNTANMRPSCQAPPSNYKLGTSWTLATKCRFEPGFILYKREDPNQWKKIGYILLRKKLCSWLKLCTCTSHCGNRIAPCHLILGYTYNCGKLAIPTCECKSTSTSARQEPNGWPLLVHWLFWWSTNPLQTKNLCKGSLKISLDTPSYGVLPFFEYAWSKGDLGQSS